MSNPAEVRPYEPLDVGAWRPLRRPVFRALWIATIASAVGTWMQDVGASWLMTSLAPTPLLVSLVQAASNLPFFVLALPAGALADVVDRRRLLMVSQAWMLLSAAALGVLTLSGAVTPVGLLILTFCLGIGSALNAPAWQAITPELVPREELPEAISLNGMAMNVARAAGPAIGGSVVGMFGPGTTFLLNAASFLGVIAVLAGWERPRHESRLPPEDLFGAIRAGIRYVRHSTELKTVLVRALSFILFGSAPWALLPLFARRTLGLGPSGYGALLGFFGVGAVAGAFCLPRLRRATSAERVTTGAVLAFAAISLVLGLTRNVKLVGLALGIGGAAWLILLASLNLAAQSAVPSWVRARAMAVHLLVIFGGMAIGSAIFGTIATFIDIPAAFQLAALGLVLGRIVTLRFPLPEGPPLDLTPDPRWNAPAVAGEPAPDRGPVLVTLEYVIDPERAADFARTMRELSRIRLRDGALRWGLFVDAAKSNHYLESFVVESWIEHLRQHERITAADREVQARAVAYHVGATPPRVTHYIHERMQ